MTVKKGADIRTISKYILGNETLDGTPLNGMTIPEMVQQKVDEVAIAAGALTSVFGRTGAVAAVAGDYDAGQVTFTPTGALTGANVQAAIAELEANKLTQAQADARVQAAIGSTGTPSATELASTQDVTTYVTGQITSLVDSAPGALDTFNELAAALGDDPNYAATTLALINEKVSHAAAQALTNPQKLQARTNIDAPSIALLGVTAAEDNLGASVGDRLADNLTVKTAIQRLTPQLNEDWGTAFPATVWPGRRFYRTDLQAGFTYDATLTKWLGDIQNILINADKESSTLFLGGIAITNLATDGMKLDYPALITRLSVSVNSAEAADIDLYLDSVTTYTLTIPSANNAASGAISIDWATGELLNAAISATTTGNLEHVFGHLEFRRVAT